MTQIRNYVLGNSRLTTILGFILGFPGIYETIQSVIAGQPVNFRTLLASAVMVLFGRVSAQEKPQSV